MYCISIQLVYYFRISSAFSTLMNFWLLFFCQSVPDVFPRISDGSGNESLMTLNESTWLTLLAHLSKKNFAIAGWVDSDFLWSLLTSQVSFSKLPLTQEIFTHWLQFVLHFIQPVSFSANSHSLCQSSVFTCSHSVSCFDAGVSNSNTQCGGKRLKLMSWTSTDISWKRIFLMIKQNLFKWTQVWLQPE